MVWRSVNKADVTPVDEGLANITPLLFCGVILRNNKDAFIRKNPP